MTSLAKSHAVLQAEGCESRSLCATTERLVDLVLAHDFAALPNDVVAAAKAFLADTLAVGVAGASQPGAAHIMAALRQGGNCGILGRPGVRMAPHDAAMLNGFQIHCLEWDGLHEPSVVIALCVTTAALASEVQSRSRSEPVSGQQLILALVTGVETAVFFGAAATTAPRFFRPSAAGLMGAALAIGMTRGFTRTQMLDLLGLAYSQVSGTMQAHWEGSEALAMQVGVAARAALTAADFVQAGLSGPHDVIDGKFGYFKLIETNDTLEHVFLQWGAPWKVTELAHKPFPAGRATQATLTAIMEIKCEAQFRMDDVEALTVHVPSLINLLVGRPFDPSMSPGYARLCMPLVAPEMIEHGLVDPRRFIAENFKSDMARANAARVHVVIDDNPDPNAMAPQRIELKLRDGRIFERQIDAPLGSPGNPLDFSGQLAKAKLCFELAAMTTCVEDLFDAASNVDLMDDAASLFNIVTQ